MIRYARAPHLWALGVGAVISGDFFGWQSALAAGFDGLLIILAVVTVLYILLSFSIAELSTTIPSGGGPYVFALHGLGRCAAFFAGLAESLKVIATCAVAAVGIGSYLNQLLGISAGYGPLWWSMVYLIFVTLNIIGVELTFRFQLFCTLLSVTLLLVFYIGAASQVSYDKWVVQQNFQYVDGWTGILKGFSFSLWFYLGIEDLPLAVEETIEPEVNMPRGLISSIITLVILSFCTVTFNSMIAPGAETMYNSVTPLLDGYKTVFGDNSTTRFFTWFLISGLISSFHSFVFCMGKLLHAIARDGFFPEILTIEAPGRGTPYIALILGSIIGLSIAITLYFTIGEARLAAVLVNLSLIGALVSYSFQLTSFITLRITQPYRPRPYVSPFGVVGAIICQCLCVFVFFTIVYTGVEDSVFVYSLVAGAGFFIIGGIYYFGVARYNHIRYNTHYNDEELTEIKDESFRSFHVLENQETTAVLQE